MLHIEHSNQSAIVCLRIYYAPGMVILLVEHWCCIFNNMEKITLNYLMKNMLIPDKTTYYIKMIEKNESLIKHIKWKARFFLYKKDPHMDKKKHLDLKYIIHWEFRN